MTTAKTKTKLWPPIHKLHYGSGKTSWQVACQVNGKRISVLSAHWTTARRANAAWSA